MSRIPEGSLIIVADGRSARVFSNVGNAHRLLLQQHGELKLGVHGEPAVGVPGDVAAPPMEPNRFARELAEQLNDDAVHHRYAHLVLIADPHTLGLIRPLLRKQAQQRLIRDLAKDLTHASLADITRALSD